jgi:predicted Fe-Mo cluster-binding NifX family protein
MKICVTSEADTLDADIDPRFGRCRYFIIVDTDTLDFEAVENPFASASGGAGIQSGQLIAERQVKAVLTGNVGPNAFDTLNHAGVEIITGVRGTVRDAIKQYVDGAFKPVQGPTVKTKSGL